MRLLEALVFLPLAAGLHLALWAVAPVGSGASSSDGGTGRRQVTLAGAQPAVATLARTWRQPPQVAIREPTLLPPVSTGADLPEIANSSPVFAPRVLPGLKPALPAAMSTGMVSSQSLRTIVDTDPPAQPQEFAPTRGIRPMPKRDEAVPRISPSRFRAQLSDPPAVADISPAPKPPMAERKPPSQPARTQRAAGGGAAPKPQSGRGGQDSVQSQDATARNILQAQWGAKIQSRVRRKLIYPRGVAGSGVVRISLTVKRGGQLAGLRLIQSSGVAKFDEAALKAVQRVRRFPKAPSGLTDPSYTFSLSLSFYP